MTKRVYIEGLMDPENRVDGAETIQIDHPLEDPNFVRTPPRDRSEVIPWDETLAIEAIIMSLRSKDPSTRVGAVITNSNNRILSSGYNGTPVGIDDDRMIYNKQFDQDGKELPLNRTNTVQWLTPRKTPSITLLAFASRCGVAISIPHYFRATTAPR